MRPYVCHSYEAVNRASKTAAPLFKWVVSQVSYAEILDRVQPLRNEVAELQVQSDTLSAQYEEQTRLTAELEASIARCVLVVGTTLPRPLWHHGQSPTHRAHPYASRQ